MSSLSLRTDWDAAIMDEINSNQGKVCLLGGRAFRHHMLGKVPAHLIRPLGDLDLFTITPHRRSATSMLEGMGLVPDKEFNLFNGKTRLIYYADDVKVDVFIDEFSMCHKLDLRKRMSLESVTLPLADLVLTKLQIFELTEKDLLDLLLLFVAVPLAQQDDPGKVNADHIAKTMAKDWGLWRTCTQNLAKLRAFAESYTVSHHVLSVPAILTKLDALSGQIERTPKSTAWKMRSVVGDKVKWYELPEEP